MVGVYSVASLSGARLNPAITVGLAATGQFAWGKVVGYIVAQIAGGVLGGVLVRLTYFPHRKVPKSHGVSKFRHEEWPDNYCKTQNHEHCNSSET
jgi:glycerol uptake facilitator protein